MTSAPSPIWSTRSPPLIPADEDGVADLFAAALDPEFLAASTNVQEFTRVQCGIDLGGASPSLTTP